MWRELIKSLTDECEFKSPVDSESLQRAERSLGVALPEDLTALLRESNGVDGEYRLGLIWSAEQIETQNLEFRQNADFVDLYMPFDHLLFFGDGGNGDQFAFRVLGGKVDGGDVYIWNHENDSRTWCASSLRRYLELAATGQLQA